MGQVITIIYLLLLIITLIIDETKGVRLIVFMMFSIPFSSYNSLLSFFSLGSVGGFNLNCIVVTGFVFFVYEIINKRKIIVRKDAVLLMLLLFSYFIGLGVSSNISNALTDFWKFLLQFLWGFSIYLYLQNKDCFEFRRWHQIFLGALTIGCLVYVVGHVCGISFIYSGIESSSSAGIAEGLAGVWGSNCLIVVLGFWAYELPKAPHPFSMLEFYESLFDLFYLMFFQRSRTTFLFAVIAIVIGIFLGFSSDHSRVHFGRQILVVVMSFVSLPFIYLWALQSNSRVVQRLMATSISSQSDTMVTRINTFTYYMKRFLEKLFTGYGFGKYLPLVNQHGRFHSASSYYTDNALINVAMKSGCFSLLFFLLFFLCPLISVFCKYRIKRDKIYLNLFFSYILFFMSSAMFTSQINHNYIVSFFAVFYAFIIYHVSRKKNEI